MDSLKILGGNKLRGKLTVKASKNALLPIIACCLMIEDEVILYNCPYLSDVEAMLKIIRHTGGKAEYSGSNLIINCRDSHLAKIDKELTSSIRSSVFILGPLLSRFAKAEVSYPGGCEIGLRPIDLHIYGLKRLNAEVKEENGCITCDGSNMRSGVVFLDFPSVGATENVIMASALKKGRTIIHNCAREPEIVDLANFINLMGGKVYGAGGDKIVVEGVKRLSGGAYYPLSDRIVAGTYMIASAITKGDLYIDNVQPRHVLSLSEKLSQMGAKITHTSMGIRVNCNKRTRAIGKIETQPYPGFPTDLQSQLVALLCVSSGCSVMVENLFENRFKYTTELCKMGADVTVKDRIAIVKGKKKLVGTKVEASDLRGGVALVLAGLCAEGETLVSRIEHVDRGYDSVEQDLTNVGASVVRVGE